MKRNFLILLFVCFVTSAFSQISLGYRQGFGTHSIKLEPQSLTFGVTEIFQMNYGLVFLYNNMNNAGVQIELNYAPKGWREERDLLPDQYYQRVINYVEVPVFGHWEIGKKSLRIVINAGPYVTFKLDESIESNNYDDIMEDSPYKHYTMPTRDMGYGAKFCTGAKYNITEKISVFGEARIDLQIMGGSDVFAGRPNGIQASRLKEVGGVFGILWNIVPQEKKPEIKKYTPKEDLYK